jgi:hypothetical protein
VVLGLYKHSFTYGAAVVGATVVVGAPVVGATVVGATVVVVVGAVVVVVVVGYVYQVPLINRSLAPEGLATPCAGTGLGVL